MRIGIDVRLWGQTGVGRYIRNLVYNLLEIDAKNQYILFGRAEDIAEIKNQILTIKENGKNWNTVETDIQWHTLAEQLHFPNILYRENLDLVHFPYFSVPIRYNKAYIVTIHDVIINKFPTGKASSLPLPLYMAKRVAYHHILSQALRGSRAVISPSLATKHEILSSYSIPEKKIFVTYEGGFDASIRPRPLQEELLHQPFFLYVGNAYPHKNLERLLRAFSLLGDINKDIRLILVGKEDYFYKRLKERINTFKHHERILFFGHAYDGELVTLYKRAAATVIPSLMEGFGLTAVEAMSVGGFVVASNIPSLNEIAGNAASYFNPRDIYDIKDKLLFAIDLPEKERKLFKDRGMRRSKFFSWRKMAFETLQIYEGSIGV